MPKYTSRVKNTLKAAPNPTKKEMASKILQAKSAKSDKVKAVVKAIAPKVAPVIKKVVSAVRQFRGAAIPVGGKLADAPDMLSDNTVDQLSPHVFIHMLNNMDMPTYQIIKGIAANYLGMEHPLRKIVRGALGGDFVFPKTLSKIAMRDVMKAQNPQQLANALHGEWLDMMSGKLSPEETGGGLFSSLKVLVKKGIAGGKKALSALASGAAQAVRIVSAGAMGAQMIGKSVNNALMNGIEVANSLSPIIQTVFPQTEGVLKSGLGKANALQELLARGIDLSSQVETAVAPAIDVLGPLGAPIALPFEEPAAAAVEPIGAGLDTSSADVAGSDVSGPRFVS